MLDWRSLACSLVSAASLVVVACGDDTIPDGGDSGTTTSGDTTTGAVTTFAPTSSGASSSGPDDAGASSSADETTLGSSGSGSTGPSSECGNGAIEGDEVCDADALDGQTCESQGFELGTLACAADCLGFDDSGCGFANCGDNVIAGKEQCDGVDLGGASCASEGFDSGTLDCSNRCQLDTSECGTCGNVIVDGDEVCDAIVLLGQTCESQGFDNGLLGCQPDCLTYDTSGCGTCGNALVDGTEVCDGDVLGGADCLTQGFDSGSLGCASDCLAFDTEGCGQCGNGVVDGDELCDGLAVAGASCTSQGFDSGLLACQPSCAAYDPAGCGTCGNGIIDGYEECDDGNTLDGDGCPGNCGGDKIIFVSSVMFTGNLGGLLGADAECQALAVAAGLPGTYMAWLSTDTESPLTRMTPSTSPYVRVDGVQVAPDWAGLIDGSLDAPINVTETGGAVPVGNTNCAGGGFPTVWTSTSNNGASQGSACVNWTSDVGTGRWGRASNTDGSWTSWCSGGNCSWVSPIYCVQQ